MADLADKKIGFSTVINKNATLANNARAAGDITAATKGNATFADARLTVQYDAGPPTAKDAVAELYVLHGDGESTEVFPNGGDGTVGTDVDPDSVHLVGVFKTVSPSTSVDEVLSIPRIKLGSASDRFVVKNVSGQTFDLTWQLDLLLNTAESV